MIFDNLKKEIVEIEKLSDRELVSLLKAGDNAAWEYVYRVTVVPVISRKPNAAYVTRRSGIPYGKIAADRNVEGYDLLSQLFLYMIGRGKIDNFRYGNGRLVGWMRYYVIKFLMDYTKTKEISTDAIDEVSDQQPQGVITDERQAGEDKEIFQLSFVELWRKNPMRAYVFMLKRLKFPAEEIKDCLGLSSSNYADKCFSRAQEDFREIAVKYSGGGK